MSVLCVEEDLIPAGSSNRPGSPLTPTHITIHNTDNDAKGADARAHARYIKGADAAARKVSWHYTVDDHRVIKHLPTSEKGWHAGTSGGNGCSIGIEVCMNQGIDQAAAFDRAALLTALLSHKLGIPAANVVMHQHWTGKHCPRLLLDKEGAWTAFKAKVAAYRKRFAPA